MRVTLNQTEIFQAITDYVRSKWKLEEATTVEISLTAGRSPKGYSADVDITYPADAASNVTTRIVDTDEPDTVATSSEEPDTAPTTDPEAPGVTGSESAANIFS